MHITRGGMMNIAYLIPGVGLTEEEKTRRLHILVKIGAGNPKVDLFEVDEGPTAIETAEDELAAVGPVVKLAKAKQAEFDALIIGCFGDVGINALRQEVAIPVIGPARVTYSIAAAAFPSFSILSLNSGFIEEEWEITQRLGIAAQVKGILAVDLPVDTIIDEPERALKHITSLAEQLDDLAVVPGCMSMAFLLEEKNILQIGTSRVVNPLRCAVRAAMAMTA